MTVAYLTPSPIQRFFDNNGLPLVGGLLTTYAAGTTTPIVTYVDSTGTTQNTNPITLNARGECSLWLLPNVGYKLALTDSAGNQIPGYPVDNIVNAALLSLYGGVDTGVANAYIINFTSPVPANTNGQFVIWLPSNSNTGPSTINVNGGGPQPILNPNGTVLGANQILANQFVAIIEINGVWQLYGGSGVGVNVGTFGAEVPLPSATTTDLGSVPGHNVAITGTTTITGFGNSAQLVAPIYVGRFTNALTLTNSASLILPGGNNINTANGDAFLAEYLGSSNWKILIYQPFGLASSATAAVKASDTSRQSTVTLTADPDLAVTLIKGQYSYELFMLFDSVAGGAGFQFEAGGTAVDSRGTSPASATGFVNAGAYGPKLESFVGAPIAYATVGTGSNSNEVLYKGSLLVSTAGTFNITWAQNSSTASNTTLRAGSYLTTTLLAQKTANSPTQRIYTTPTTASETIPANVTQVVIEVFGGAGGGGGGFTGGGGGTSGGGGGGSGGYSRTTISVAGDSGQTMNYTVGAAGGPSTSGAASSVSSGTFSVTTLTANGGHGGGNAPGLVNGGAGGVGGTASGGVDVNTTGNTGGNGVGNAGGGAGGAGGAGVSGINFGGFAGGNGGNGIAGITGGTGAIVFTYT